MKKVISINDREIGLNHPPYIIAEISANHNGSLEKAKQTIYAAKKSGVDAVKIQTYTADSLTIDCDDDDFLVQGGLWDGYNLYELYQWAHTPYEWHPEIFNYARKIGVTLFSTPFDEEAVNLLEDLNSPAYKIASFEANDLALIEYVASTGKPIIISTGMAGLEEIEEIVETVFQAGGKDLVLLHCISSYPAPVNQANLKTIPDLNKRFDVITGLSDHTLGTAVSVASVALGACVIEKHFTLSRKDIGPDSAFSIEPDQLIKLCMDARDAWLALGSVSYERQESEQTSIKFRRSLYVIQDIQAGEKLTKSNIRSIRPGYGLAPKYLPEVLGKTAIDFLARGTALKWENIK
jgi:N-acetylneuraminate synthase